MSKYRVVFVRHGESEWTHKNLFCGWIDSGLTDKGKQKLPNIIFNLAFYKGERLTLSLSIALEYSEKIR